MSDSAGGVIATVAVMGIVYWIAYWFVMALAIIAAGALFVVMVGVVCTVFYFIGIGRYVRAGNRQGAIHMLLVPGSLAVLSTLMAYLVGPAFWDSVAAIDQTQDARLATWLFGVPCSLFVWTGWFAILFFMGRMANEHPAVRFSAITPIWLYGLVALWSLLGGSAFAHGIL